IVQSLLDAGVEVRAYDPEGIEAARALMPDVDYCDSAYAVADGAHAVAIVTEWNAFRALNLIALGDRMAEKRMVDLRNIYDPAEVRRLGFDYVGVGRG
ncbi:MAG TPA: UDP binding domain-containing protein, partial [Sphingomonas sp.]|nr:UDP binding domain-containing protein [Sphingomonas sp.]